MNNNNYNDNDNYRKNKVYKNIAELQVDVCGENYTLRSNEVDVDKISVRVEKIANKCCVFTGDELKYTIKICNDSGIDIYNAVFSDCLPKGLLLEPETFEYNYVHYNPMYNPSDNKVSYCINKLCAYSEAIITFCTKVL